MQILDLIEKKKNKFSLSKKEYFWFVELLVKNEIPDYQVSSLLMAIFINGMNDDELFNFTEALINNSKKINGIPNNFLNISIDKHSSGGVGDKVSLIISPILVALGYDVIKLSGRGLSFTGGTIDKLESIGISYEYNENNFQSLLDETHMILMLQSEDIVPGDKKLYALRDVTGTIDSFPLIAASIMSKKLIIENDYIFLDIKIGEGAFFKTIEKGEEFAKLVLKISKKFNRKTVIHLTNMNQPLGRTIGNAIEVKETIDFLQNKMESSNLKKLIYEFITDILIDTNIAKNKIEATSKINEVIHNKKAYYSFMNFVKTFSNDYKKVESNNYFNPKNKIEIFSKQDGYLHFESTKNLGLLSNFLGAGRFSKEDIINYDAGIELHFDPFSYVEKDQKIATLYSNKEITNELINKFYDCLVYSNEFTQQKDIIIKKIQ